MKQIFLIFIILGAFAHCAAADSGKREFKIGLLAEFSGPSSINGLNCSQGYELARRTFAPDNKIGDVNLTFLHGDTKGEALTGVNEFKKLVEIEHAIAAISNRSQIGMALNPISKQKRVPLLGVVGHSEFVNGNPYAFRFWPSAKIEAPVLAAKIVELKKKKLAIVTTEDEWTISFTKSFVEEYQSRGAEIVFQETVTGDPSEFPSLITKMKRSNPDALFMNLTVAQLGIMIKKIREQGMTQQIFSNYWSGSKDVLEVAGKETEGLIFDAPKTTWKRFSQHLKEYFDQQNPSGVTYGCYAALSTLIQTFAAHPEIHDSESLYKALLDTKSVKLLDGELQIKEREAQIEIEIYTIKDGKVVPIQ